MTRKPLLALLTSAFLLPASCASGIAANNMQSVRLGVAAGEGGPLWIENLLWTGALALMLVWAHRIKKLYRTEDVQPAPKEVVE